MNGATLDVRQVQHRSRVAYKIHSLELVKVDPKAIMLDNINMMLTKRIRKIAWIK